MKLAVPMMCAWYLHERPLPAGLDVVERTQKKRADPGAVGPWPSSPTWDGRVIAVAGVLVIILAAARGALMVALLGCSPALGALFGLELHATTNQRKRVLCF